MDSVGPRDQKLCPNTMMFQAQVVHNSALAILFTGILSIILSIKLLWFNLNIKANQMLRLLD